MSEGWRFGKVVCRRGYLFIAIGPKQSHLVFTMTLPSFNCGWYGGPEWYYRWRGRRPRRNLG